MEIIRVQKDGKVKTLTKDKFYVYDKNKLTQTRLFVIGKRRDRKNEK